MFRTKTCSISTLSTLHLNILADDYRLYTFIYCNRFCVLRLLELWQWACEGAKVGRIPGEQGSGLLWTTHVYHPDYVSLLMFLSLSDILVLLFFYYMFLNFFPAGFIKYLSIYPSIHLSILKLCSYIWSPKTGWLCSRKIWLWEILSQREERRCKTQRLSL